MKFITILLLLFSLPLYAARKFNGTTDTGSVSAVGNILDLGGGSTSELSWSVWAYMTSVPGSLVSVFGKGNSSNTTQLFNFEINDPSAAGLIGANVHQSASLNHFVDIYCTTPLVANTWYNFAAEWKGSVISSMKLFVNGVECDSLNVGAGTPSGTLQNVGANNPNICFAAPNSTGSPGTCSASNFAVTLAEAAIWNKALTNNELASLYHVCPAAVRRTNLIWYAPLAGASGSSIEPDFTGSGIPVNLTGTTAANHPPCVPKTN
jgi:hypothetical protein